MKKLTTLALVLAILGMLLSVAMPAYAKPAKSTTTTVDKAKTAPKTPAKKDAKKTTPAGVQSVSGIVKGAPSGKTFVVARKGGTVTVDASKAKVRDKSGKFASFNEIKGGLMLTAKGAMSGTTLVATEITIYPSKKKDTTTTTTKTKDTKKKVDTTKKTTTKTKTTK